MGGHKRIDGLDSVGQCDDAAGEEEEEGNNTQRSNGVQAIESD